MLTDAQILDLWKRLWESATDETDRSGRRLHTGGMKWLLTEYGVVVTKGRGPHAPIRLNAFARLKRLGAIERIGGGAREQTTRMWVRRPD